MLESGDELDDTPGIEAPAEPDNWDILLGILAAVHPDYNGSNEYKTSAAPYFRIDWKERIILGGRDENDNFALADLGDDESVIELGGFARYKHGPYRFRMTAAQDIGDGRNGALVEMATGAQTYLPVLGLC